MYRSKRDWHLLSFDGNAAYPYPLDSLVKSHLCVERLREAGHDVLYIAEANTAAKDSAILLLAGHESRVLITEDRDFGTLVYGLRKAPPAGVVYIRLGFSTPGAIADALVEIIEDENIELEGRFTVLELGRIRQRLLPPI